MVASRENMTGQAQLRRIQDTLTISGTAVIAFSVWSLAKIGLFLTFANENMLSWLLGLDKESLTVAVYVSLVVVALVDMGVRVYVGTSARAEGRGAKKGPFYLVVAVIIALGNASSLAAIAMIARFALSPLALIVPIAVEATATAALVLVISCSIRLRHMNETAE
jgi:magnesium-transporting ATPase (P-type)